MLAIQSHRSPDEISVLLAGCSMDAEPVVVNLDTGDCARVQPTELVSTPWSARYGYGSDPRPRLPNDNAWVALLPSLPPEVDVMRLLIVADGQQHRCRLRWPQPPAPPSAPAPQSTRRRRTRQ